jgi:hypothetical protein
VWCGLGSGGRCFPVGAPHLEVGVFQGLGGGGHLFSSGFVLRGVQRGLSSIGVDWLRAVVAFSVCCQGRVATILDSVPYFSGGWDLDLCWGVVVGFLGGVV